MLAEARLAICTCEKWSKLDLITLSSTNAPNDSGGGLITTQMRPACLPAPASPALPTTTNSSYLVSPNLFEGPPPGLEDSSSSKQIEGYICSVYEVHVVRVRRISEYFPRVNDPCQIWIERIAEKIAPAPSSSSIGENLCEIDCLEVKEREEEEEVRKRTDVKCMLARVYCCLVASTTTTINVILVTSRRRR